MTRLRNRLNKAPTSTTTSPTPSLPPPPGEVKILVRKDVDNPVEYFDKTYSEYKEGFSKDGVFKEMKKLT